MKYSITFLCAGFILLSTLNSYAQISSLGGADGNSSIILSSADKSNSLSNVSITSKDPNLTFNYQSAGNKFSWGLNIAGTAKGSDLASIFSATPAALSATLALGATMSNLFVPQPTAGNPASSWDLLYLGLGAVPHSVELTPSATSQQLVDSSWTGYVLRLGYNYITTDWNKGSLLFGGAILYRKSDNTDTLSQVTVKSGSTSKMAYTGKYIINTNANLNFDILWIPYAKDTPIGFSIYSRTQLGEETNIGIGLYYMKANMPAVVQGGIVIETRDLFNSLNSSSSVQNRTSINLVAGYPL